MSKRARPLQAPSSSSASEDEFALKDQNSDSEEVANSDELASEGDHSLDGMRRFE